MAALRNASATAIGTWMRCPQCFQERYVGIYDMASGKYETRKEPPTGNLLFGRVYSEALEALHRGQDWESVFAKSYSTNARVAETFGTQLVCTPESGLHLLHEYIRGGVYNGVPERGFKVQVNHLPIPVTGYFDLEEQDWEENPIGVIEFKTTSADWTQEKVDEELQGTLYWIAFWNLYRRLPHMTYVVSHVHKLTVERFETMRTRDYCIEVLDNINKCLDEMDLAADPENGVYPGFCDRHKIKTPRVVKEKNYPILNLEG